MYFHGLPNIVFVAPVFIGICLIIVGGVRTAPADRKPKERVVGLVIVVAGVLLICFILNLSVVIEPGNLGIDKKGNWYAPGNYFATEGIEIVSLTGSIPMADNLQLQYSLTPEEAMSMNAGKNFPEKLGDALSLDKIYFVQDSEFVRVRVRGSIDGVNLSHLKLMTSFDPPFFI